MDSTPFGKTPAFRNDDEETVHDLTDTQYEQQAPQGVGLAQHLDLIAENLLILSQTEKDPDKKDEYYSIISDRLCMDADRLRQMVEGLNLEDPDAPPKVTQEVDEEFARAANFFLDAIDNLEEFMETENPVLVEHARKSIQAGAKYLDIADEKCQKLKDPDIGIRA